MCYATQIGVGMLAYCFNLCYAIRMKKLNKFALLILLTLISSVIFTACGKLEFKVQFIVDDEICHTINTNGEETIKMPADPTKDGFFFDGWYWDNNSWQRPFTANSLLNEPLSENLRVYAKWNNENSLEGTQIRFLNGLKVSDNTYMLKVSNVSTIADVGELVTVNNKSSWVLTSDIQGNNIINSNIATLPIIGNNTYYVLVTAGNGSKKMYTLQIRRRPMFSVYFSTSGTYIATQSVEEDSLAIQPANPTRTGYTFIGWNKNFNTPITVSTTITANWEANQYSVTYYANNGGSNTETQTVTYATSFLTKNNLTFSKESYYLARWNTLATGLGTNYNCNYAFSYSIANDISLHAIWIPTQYQITYVLDNGMNNMANPTVYTIESNEIIISDASKTGYTFDGWYSENTFENRIYSISTNSSGNKTFYAKFNINTYNITYNLNDGTHNNATTYTVESNINLADASRTGYTFDGWYSENTFENRIYNTQGRAENLELYAKFLLITYNINYILNGGSYNINPTSYTILSDNIEFSSPSRLGYDFAGWFTNEFFLAETKMENILSGSSLGNITLYAKWLANGDGTVNSPILISTVNELLLFENAVNSISNYSVNKYFALRNDIDLNGAIWIPIGRHATRFQGNFNGNGYNINNFSITTVTASQENITYYSYAGLFGYNTGTIQNVGVKDFSISVVNSYNPSFGNTYGSRTIRNYVGGIVGCNTGTIKNCYTIGTVSGTSSIYSYAGGTAYVYVGGFVGYNTGTISNSFTTANVTASATCSTGVYPHSDLVSYCYAGGFVGYSNKAISNSFATGNVNATATTPYSSTNSATYYLGGFIGNTCALTNCYNLSTQSFNNGITNTEATLCTIDDLNNNAFYTATLGWSASLWDFSEIDLAIGKLPILINGLYE